MSGTVSAPGGPRSPEHHTRKTTSWVAGVVLILLGIAFFLDTTHYVALTGNWWAVFLYLAAVACFVNAWRSYRMERGFTRGSTGSLIWGLVFTVSASIFIFNLLWDVWWPAILVAVGAGIVVGYAFRAPSDGDTGGATRE